MLRFAQHDIDEVARIATQFCAGKMRVKNKVTRQ
jgi:hypothetical protein